MNRGSGIGIGTSMGGDAKTTIMGVIREIAKQNKFIHRNDIYTVVQNSMNHDAFEKAI